LSLVFKINKIFKNMSEEQKKSGYPEVKPGMTVRVHQKIKEKNVKGEDKERVQVFEGMVLAQKHGAEVGSTITVRKVSGGIGVEKIFPLNSPNIENIEIIKKARVRRSKLGFLRSYKKRLREKKIA
jgi:large subunit ribosomal protein L19